MIYLLSPDFDWKIFVALWGALTGTVGLALSLRTAWNDRSMLKFGFSSRLPPDVEMASDKQWLVSCVTNSGRRRATFFAPKLRTLYDPGKTWDYLPDVAYRGGQRLSNITSGWDQIELGESDVVYLIYVFDADEMPLHISLHDYAGREVKSKIPKWVWKRAIPDKQKLMKESFTSRKRSPHE